MKTKWTTDEVIDQIDDCIAHIGMNQAVKSVMLNARDLLKEQEAIEAKKDLVIDIFGHQQFIYYCGNCGEELYGKYCSRCGKAAKLDE